MVKRNMAELLAPAGDLERLKLAFHYGADACYIGGKDFSLRANAKNFSKDDIKEAVKIGIFGEDGNFYLELIK